MNFKKIKKLKEELKNLYAEGIISIYPYDARVQVTLDVFMETFTDHSKIVRYGDDEYPLEYRAVVDGITYFALVRVVGVK